MQGALQHGTKAGAASRHMGQRTNLSCSITSNRQRRSTGSEPSEPQNAQLHELMPQTGDTHKWKALSLNMSGFALGVKDLEHLECGMDSLPSSSCDLKMSCSGLT
jgi:hypothetical protein